MPHATNETCTIYYETFGSPGDPTLLLVNGLGSQCINYAAEWCKMFVTAGFHVIRFDNRDVGLSTHFTDAATDERGAAYRLADMAADAVAVLDAAGDERAHVMGLSMGGMIVQHLAIHHRDRLLSMVSMVSMMSRTGEPEYGGSTPEALARLTGAPATDRDSAIANSIEGMHIWSSPEFADEERCAADAGRAFDVRSTQPVSAGSTSPSWPAVRGPTTYRG